MLKRSVLRISGHDSATFLNGLMTNSIEHNSFYTAFLNRKGRILSDAFVSKKDDSTFFLDCDPLLSDALRQHLQAFRIREDVLIDDVSKQYSVRVDCGDPDPRIKELGVRSIVERLHIDTEQSECSNAYATKRYSLGVAEGLEVANQIPFQCNLDLLGAITYGKCYLGQELMARTRFRGVVRKRCYPITFDRPVHMDASQVKIGKGKLIGTHQNLGLYITSDVSNIHFQGAVGTIHIPTWFLDRD